MLKVYGGAERSPKIAFVSGRHGTDVNSQFVLMRLNGFLRQLEAGRDDGPRLSDGVLVLNAGGGLLLPDWRTSIARCYYRIELSVADDSLETSPQVVLCQPFAEERATACLCGLNIIFEKSAPLVADSTLGQVGAQGGENFLIELGQKGVFNAQYCERVFHALVSMMYRLGLIAGIELAEVDESLHFFEERQSCPIVSDRAGFFVPVVGVGQWIQAGAVLGRVYDYVDDTRILEIKSPVTGMLAALRRNPNVCAGDKLTTILARDS